MSQRIKIKNPSKPKKQSPVIDQTHEKYEPTQQKIQDKVRSRVNKPMGGIRKTPSSRGK